ncbi:GWxTD domain-containing protein [candidate division KSB1 bacterium]|nr:GWxTD domain-containing protein [candidate division KSB1 bacterium]
MKKFFTTISLIFILSLIASTSVSSAGKLNISMNICQYRFNQDTSLVELYYGLYYNADSLEMNNNASTFLVSLRISHDNQMVFNNLWQVENRATMTGNENNQQMLVDVLRYLLTPGIYNFKFVARDVSCPTLIDSLEFREVVIRKISDKDIAMSDIELAQTISPANPQNKDRFYKNGYRVIPNPISLYDETNNQAYYYIELYNFQANIKESYYHIQRTIFDNYGLPIPSLPVYKKKKLVRGDDAVEVGMFSIAQVPDGKYTLEIAVLDSAGANKSTSRSSFFVHNPQVTPLDRASLPEETQVANSEIAFLSPEDIEILLGVTRYFLNDQDKEVITGLTTLDAKKLFLYRFWKGHDVNAETPVLESLKQILTSIQNVNSNFGGMKTPGWQSDRGRVYILYGKPSEVQYYPNLADFKEFQAWSYDHIENGVVFIFGVLGGFGDFRLLHSTKTGEIYNDSWLDLVKVSKGDTGINEIDPAGGSRRETIREIFQRYNLELPRYLK